LQDPPKFIQIWIFGLKTNHLATLHLEKKTSFFFCFVETLYFPQEVSLFSFGGLKANTENIISIRVARFFLEHDTKNVPNGHKISQMFVKYIKWHKKYINIFQNLPKLRFLV
jgi:hypothetical protein